MTIIDNDAPQLSRSAVYLRDVIYGAMDGAVTTFAVVSGVTGAGLSSHIVLILGVAGVVGDGFSMAAGNYLGTKAETQRLAGENGGKKRRTGSRPLIAAMATFVSFLIAGAIPLLPYVVSAYDDSLLTPAPWSVGLTLVTFFLIGAGKSLVIPVRWWAAGLESLGIGAIAASLAYVCGHWLGGLA